MVYFDNVINIATYAIILIQNSLIGEISAKFPCRSNPCVSLKVGCVHINNDTAYKCECRKGFTGNGCYSDIDECNDGSHKCDREHAHCENIRASYKCVCHPGFKGIYCKEKIILSGYCAKYKPCNYDMPCSDTETDYTCKCIGYKGVNCSEDLAECEKENMCNSGKCIELQGSYRCECTKKYYGANCQFVRDPCLDKPCKTGQCVKLGISTFQCKCGDQYRGLYCEKNVNLCINKPCVNGRCTFNEHTYICTCIDGYQGTNCDKDVDECYETAYACKNNAVCTNYHGGFECDCSQGFKGHICQEEDVDYEMRIVYGVILILLLGLIIFFYKYFCDVEFKENINLLLKFGGNTENIALHYELKYINSRLGPDKTSVRTLNKTTSIKNANYNRSSRSSRMAEGKNAQYY